MLNIGNIGNIPKSSLDRRVEWPNNSPFGVCLTHDVDRVKKTYQYVTHSIKQRKLEGILEFFTDKKEPYWQFDKITELEDRYGVRSTFFFLNESIKFNLFSPKNWPFSLGRYNIKSPEIKEIISSLDKGGWEIGIHGSIRSYKNISLLKNEKRLLEKIVGHEISGGRQHWLNLKIPETWKIHKSIGLKYDSSYGKKYDIGFKKDRTNSFSPFGDNFLVFPLAIMDSYLFSKYPNFDEAVAACKRVIDIARKENGLLTILWHQSTFNEADFRNYSKVYEYIIKECLNNNAWFGTCEQAYNHINTF